jgi:hypothetical protein
MPSHVEWGHRWVVGLLAVAALSGCGSLQSASSGQIGCAEDDIVISNDERGFGTRTWVATCHGKRFFCSAVSGGESVQVSCKEATRDEGGEMRRGSEPRGEMVRRPEQEAPRRSEPEPGGCQYDTQCKGDRVCDDGECISPRTNAPAPAAPAASAAPVRDTSP